MAAPLAAPFAAPAESGITPMVCLFGVACLGFGGCGSWVEFDSFGLKKSTHKRYRPPLSAMITIAFISTITILAIHYWYYLKALNPKKTEGSLSQAFCCTLRFALGFALGTWQQPRKGSTTWGFAKLGVPFWGSL